MAQKKTLVKSKVEKENITLQTNSGELTKADINSLREKGKNLTQNVVYRYIRAKTDGIEGAKMVTMEDVNNYFSNKKDSIADKKVHLVFLPFLLKNKWMMGVFLCGQIYMVNLDFKKHRGIKTYFDWKAHNRYLREKYRSDNGDESDCSYFRMSSDGSYIANDSEYSFDNDDEAKHDSYICELDVCKSKKNLETIRDVLKFLKRKNKRTGWFHADRSKIENEDSGVYICKMVDFMIEKEFYDKKKFSDDIHERHDILSMSYGKIEENTKEMKEYKEVIREFLQK